MTEGTFRWPSQLAANTVCFTVDVEWAAQPVLDDIRDLFDTYGIKATFFVTHADIAVPGHERGLHPNFRRNGDTYRKLADADAMTDEAINRHIMVTTRAFAPEAKGVRAHSLHSDSTLLPLYRELGLEYDSCHQMPHVEGIRPFWIYGPLVELPIYYGDSLDISVGMTDFRVARLALDRPGLKVLNFHPNIVYINANSNAAQAATRTFYHDPEKLRASRNDGKGIRTLLLDTLEYVRRQGIPTAVLQSVNEQWRTLRPWS
jgi:peptidoglycan/xylan/chitin deacetylase (PgdA/CDA1 family)